MVPGVVVVVRNYQSSSTFSWKVAAKTMLRGEFDYCRTGKLARAYTILVFNFRLENKK